MAALLSRLVARSILTIVACIIIVAVVFGSIAIVQRASGVGENAGTAISWNLTPLQLSFRNYYDFFQLQQQQQQQLQKHQLRNRYSSFPAPKGFGLFRKFTVFPSDATLQILLTDTSNNDDDDDGHNNNNNRNTTKNHRQRQKHCLLRDAHGPNACYYKWGDGIAGSWTLVYRHTFQPGDFLEIKIRLDQRFATTARCKLCGTPCHLNFERIRRMPPGNDEMDPDEYDYDSRIPMIPLITIPMPPCPLPSRANISQSSFSWQLPSAPPFSVLTGVQASLRIVVPGGRRNNNDCNDDSSTTVGGPSNNATLLETTILLSMN